MKTSELKGALLDYWVAQADPKGAGMRWEQHGADWIGFALIGSSPEFAGWIVTDATLLHDRATLRDAYPSAIFYSPSTDWSKGGPIIEREMIELIHDRDWREDGEFGRVWQGHDAAGGFYDGDTPLIAAMRSFVAAKFGHELPEAGAAPAHPVEGESDAQRLPR